jgi:hypothetical protein
MCYGLKDELTKRIYGQRPHEEKHRYTCNKLMGSQSEYGSPVLSLQETKTTI